MNLIERISDWISDVITDDQEILLCENLQEAFIGLQYDGTDTPRAVYDADKILSILCRDSQMSYEEALEFYEFNILGSHVGPGTPIYINRFPEA
jgi:hypothetical protein